MDVKLSDAIAHLRSELRTAVLDRPENDIVLTLTEIELELALKFTVEASASAGFKLLAFLDLSAEGKAGREQGHRIKLKIHAADLKGEPLKVASQAIPEALKAAMGGGSPGGGHAG